jgi:hypothetical protein
MRRYHSLSIKTLSALKVCRPGILASNVVDGLCIHIYSLYRWKKELRDAELVDKMPNKIDIQIDLALKNKPRQLEKENELPKMENAVLKKPRRWA